MTSIVGSGKTKMSQVFHFNHIIPLILEMTDKVPHHVVDTIAKGISGRGLFGVARRRYAKQVFTANVISLGFPENIIVTTEVNIVFSKEDYIGINSHDNDPLLITIQHGN